MSNIAHIASKNSSLTLFRHHHTFAMRQAALLAGKLAEMEDVMDIDGADMTILIGQARAFAELLNERLLVLRTK